jgi:hypothetical protein
MEKDTENEANLQELSKTFKKVKFIKVPIAAAMFHYRPSVPGTLPTQVPPSKATNLVEEYDIQPHELPTFLFIEVVSMQAPHCLRLVYRSFPG